jgi:outer membrane protein insertion porin family/translocation and assembly module TamA
MRRHAGVACIAREASTTSIAGFAPREWTIRLLSVVAASACLAASIGAQSETAGSNRPLVTAVVLRGVKSVDINLLRDGLVTRGTACKSPLYLPVCWITRSPIFNARHHLDPLEFRRDVLRIRIFYWQRGWRDAAVVARTERTGAGVRAVFEIDEKEPTVISNLRVVQSDSVLPRSAIDRALQLEARDPLDLIAMDSTILMLRDELWERGHASANIVLDTTQVSDVSNGGPVSIVIEPGPLVRVSAVQFAGNQKVSDRTIHRLLTFKSGDLFKRSTILGSQRNLYLSGLFSELEIDTPPAGDTLRLVRVRVVEADLNRLELAGGLTTADFGQVDGDFTRYNFLGSARRLTLRGTVSNLLASSLNGQGIFYDVTDGADGGARDDFLRPTWSASVSVLQPWLFSVHSQLGVSVFAHRRAVPGIMIERGHGASLALTRDLGPRTNSTLGYTYEVSRVDASDVYFCVSFGVCLKPTIDVLARGNILSPLASVTQFDMTLDPFTPDRGYRARIDVEHASGITGSDFRYNRAELIGSWYHGITRTAVLAFRARLGWVGAIRGTNRALGVAGPDAELVVHPRKRFYAGGSQSVRGFGERQLGPRVLTVSPTALTDTALAAPCTTAQLQDRSCDPNLASLDAAAFQPQPLGGTVVGEASIEYRFPLSPARGISGAIFLDGAVIGTNQLSGLLGATSALTPGFGVRMDTPVGPVRLDLGIRPRLVEDLPVVTQVTNADGSVQLVTLNTTRKYNPNDSSGGFFRQVLSRLRLHLAIGPPF